MRPPLTKHEVKRALFFGSLAAVLATPVALLTHSILAFYIGGAIATVYVVATDQIRRYR